MAENYRTPYGNRGTVNPYSGFNANDDAEKLHKAMKGMGTDEDAIMDVLCHRSNDQRQKIKSAYKTMFGKDLVEHLVKELKGHFEELILALMDAEADFDAKTLRNAMAGAGTNEALLIEILCTRTNQEIENIKMQYRFRFARDLEKDVVSETSSDLQRILVSMCQGGRDESTNVDHGRASRDAEKLYKAGEKKLGTDESMFNAILASQNYLQLQQVFREYLRLTGHEIEKSIASEFSGDVENAFMTIVHCVKNRPLYFANKLQKSMKGMGTRDDDLIRTVVTRCEKDMVEIKQEFEQVFGKSLEKTISGDTSGDYKKGLLMLVEGN